MAHPRKLLRHAAVGQLKGRTAAGQRVQGTRVRVDRKTKLPAIAVYTTREPIDPGSGESTPRELRRWTELRIVTWLELREQSDDDDAQDLADDMAEQIEAAMDSDRSIGGTAGDCVLTDTELDIDPGGDPLVGKMTMTYTVTYHTTPGTMTPSDDYLRTDAKTKIKGAADDNLVEDLFEMRPP